MTTIKRGWNRVSWITALWTIRKNKLQRRLGGFWQYHFWEFQDGFTIVRRSIFEKWPWQGWYVLYNGSRYAQFVANGKFK